MDCHACSLTEDENGEPVSTMQLHRNTRSTDNNISGPSTCPTLELLRGHDGRDGTPGRDGRDGMPGVQGPIENLAQQVDHRVHQAYQE